MTCPLCKGKMVKSRTNLPHEMEEDQMVVVKDVPALVCRQCGDSFIEIDVLRVVERIVAVAEKDGVTLGFIRYKEAA